MQIEIRPAVKVFFSRVCLLLSVRIKKQTVTNEHGQQRKTTATTADHRTANNGTANAARVRTKNSDSRPQVPEPRKIMAQRITHALPKAFYIIALQWILPQTKIQHVNRSDFKNKCLIDQKSM